MSKLLPRAKVKLVNAENDYRRLSEDDAFLDDCCYNIQQAIELAVKALLELSGENYVETHDIRAQLNKLRIIGVDFPFEEEIRRNASTLNSWEAESRYNDNFTALLEDIEELMELARRILTYVDGLVTEIP